MLLARALRRGACAAVLNRATTARLRPSLACPPMASTGAGGPARRTALWPATMYASQRGMTSGGPPNDDDGELNLPQDVSWGRLEQGKVALLVCDVQTAFANVVHGFGALVEVSALMLKGAKILSIPVIVTEQYPKALGRTVEELVAHMPEGTMREEKLQFSMSTEAVMTKLAELSIEQVLIVGLEAHVCVLQTCLDMMDAGIAVHVLADAVSSQRPGDRAIALQRMMQSGAVISTSETALFQIMGGSSHPQFKLVSALVRERRQWPGVIGPSML